MATLLQFLFLFSIIVASLGYLHTIPDRVIAYTNGALCLLYAFAAAALASIPAGIMALYFLGLVFFRPVRPEHPAT